MVGTAHARAGDVHLAGVRVEHRVLHGGVAPRVAADGQATVEHVENIVGRLAALVYAAQRTDGKRGVQRGGQALAAHVAEV